MPDVRLRPSGLPGDVTLVAGERPQVDVALRAGISPDVTLAAGIRHGEPAASVGSEAHSGTGSLAASASLASTGAKNGQGAATVALAYSEAQSGRKGGQGAGSLALSYSTSQSDRKAGLGTGSLALSAALSATGGASQPETHSGTGAMALAYAMSPSESAVAGRHATGPRFLGYIQPKPEPAVQRSGGSGTIALSASLAASGYQTADLEDDLLVLLAA